MAKTDLKTAKSGRFEALKGVDANLKKKKLVKKLQQQIKTQQSPIKAQLIENKSVGKSTMKLIKKNQATVIDKTEKLIATKKTQNLTKKTKKSMKKKSLVLVPKPSVTEMDSDSDAEEAREDEAACKTYKDDFGFDEQDDSTQEDNDNEDEEEEKRLEKSNKTITVRDPSENERTICITNVNVKTNKKLLLAVFKKYGKVESIRYRNCPIAHIEKNKKDQIFKGRLDAKRTSMTAYIKYMKPEMATEALKANNTEVLGHHLQVQPTNASSKHDMREELSKGCTIFIGNVPSGAEEEPMYQLFQGCGAIAKLHIVRYKTQASGIAFIQFKSKAGVAAALQMTEVKYMGRELRVNKAVRKVKKSKAEGNQQHDVKASMNPKSAVNKGSKSAANKGPKSAVNKGPKSAVNKGPKAAVNKGPKAAVNKGPKAAANKEPKSAASKSPKSVSLKSPKQVKRLQKNAASPKIFKKKKQATAGASPGAFAGQKFDQKTGGNKQKGKKISKDEKKKVMLAKKLNPKKMAAKEAN